MFLGVVETIVGSLFFCGVGLVQLCHLLFAPIRNTLKLPQNQLFLLSNNYFSVILLPLRPSSLMHKNPQGHKIIHGMHPVGHNDGSINLNMSICRNIRPVCVISVAVIMGVV